MDPFLFPYSRIPDSQSHATEYYNDEPEPEVQVSQGCPKCLSENHDYSFLSRLGIPWLAHKAQLRLDEEPSSPLEWACYFSTENFDEDKLSITSNKEKLLRLFLFLLSLCACYKNVPKMFPC